MPLNHDDHDDHDETVRCKCGNPGVEGFCPYEIELDYEDPTYCTCCEECRAECAADV